MIAIDPTLPARQATVSHLRADTGVTSKPIGERIYGERPPSKKTWPWALYVADFGQTGGSIAIHVFSKAKFTDEVAEIMAAIVTSLGAAVIEMDDGRKLHLQYPDFGGSQILSDAAEADAWHGIVRFDAFIPRECAAA